MRPPGKTTVNLWIQETMESFHWQQPVAIVLYATGYFTPLCGSRLIQDPAYLSRFNRIDAYGQTFESQESAALFVNELKIGGIRTNDPVGDESSGGIVTSEHERLVQEIKRRMMPDERPRLNRSKLTKDNNRK
jgi:hypothetical protein